jgi:hypothetical protein
MDVLFLAPAYPPEMIQFTRGLSEVGARVWGVGDTPAAALPERVRRHLTGYLHVPAILDEDDVLRRVLAWLNGRVPDRVEGNWEPVTVLAARIREALGVPGMSVDTVLGFRDKVTMHHRVAAAGLRVAKTARVRSPEEAREAAASIGYPVVVKPVAGAGSADTWRAGSPQELEAVLAKTRNVREISLEEWITGDEYTYETICIDGKIAVESVTRYYPNVLDARKNEWISPIIFSIRDLTTPEVLPGVQLGRQVISALGMGTGFTHMEWFRTPSGEAVFGEIACRAPGANMVDLMNYTCDEDFFREWARAVCWKHYAGTRERKYNAAIIFKRAMGQGRIRAHHGIEAFRDRFGPWIAREELVPVGSPRRDWQSTFLADGNLVVRHPERAPALFMAEAAQRDVTLIAG